MRVENAAAKYSGLYNEFYAAINDFLVAHGYEPIGFIKGYAPHFQPEAESGKLERALKAIGVDLGAEVGKLPASIAGLTKEFKPNKRYNPFSSTETARARTMTSRRALRSTSTI